MVDETAVAPPDDDSLVARAKSGDEAAFDELYVRHNEAVSGYLRSRVGCPDLAEDLATDAFVRALARLEQYSRGNFAAWLFSIARNLSIDHFRRRVTKPEVPVGEFWPDIAMDDAPGPEGAAIAALEAQAGARLLADALSRLTADQRTCLQLRFFDDRTIAEVATAMKRSSGAVRVLQHRGLKTLRELLTSAEVSPL